MNSQPTKLFLGFIAFVFLCFLPTLFVFKLWHDHELKYPHSIYNFAVIEDYEIDPYTILANLNQGKQNVFKSIGKDSDRAKNLPTTNSFSWTQSDYLTVANALHQFVWGETLDGWKIYSMKFYRDCQNEPVGFSSTDITYFKYNNEKGGYKVHEMTIYPNSHGVSQGGTDDWSRPLFGWRSVNLRLLRITADDALHIAEKKGGKDFRAKLKNSCEIYLILVPNPSGDNDWKVYYSANSSSDRYEISIDPYTGWH